MYYYKNCNSDGKIVTLNTYSKKLLKTIETMVEITEDEYQKLLEEMLANMETKPNDQISDSEALEIITGSVI